MWWSIIIKQVTNNILFKLVCNHILFCIHDIIELGNERKIGCITKEMQACNPRTPPPPPMIIFCLRMSAAFGLSRGQVDPGWNQSMTVIGLILLKEPGHHGAGVPVTQKTQRKLIFRNVLMLLACMSVSEGMICCVCWYRTGKDGNSVKWL